MLWSRGSGGRHEAAGALRYEVPESAAKHGRRGSAGRHGQGAAKQLRERRESYACYAGSRESYAPERSCFTARRSR